jgi:hypothetical protein
MAKHAVLLINIDPTSTKTDAQGRYHITDYSYGMLSGTWPLPGDPTRYTNDKGKLVQRYCSADMAGGDWKIMIIPSSAVTWAAPSVTVTFRNKSTGGLATPLDASNPQTIMFPGFSYSTSTGPSGWYMDYSFNSPPAMGRYEYEIAATFEVNGANRTYFVDPEMDCSDTST